ncbi:MULTISPECIES: methylenetetrahydrofolate reductase [unclassified Nocardioides]|uniref:methylenetetrahydrofolate reductase n=1 Tax=unclassified Nocardioides TaxID=2615069 RepID=UPI0006F2A7A7|nr:MULTISPECIES: methylenetetrahydrofolate reductase [unclassified Nocardioides]KRA37835.1 5,10-methylenetetrahydrofolate reductase [Nocardioides sp. Root614]KRA91795.1 5,10-methylenetetrahydrofolate reductase [Nocardioides sp. Root682]
MSRRDRTDVLADLLARVRYEVLPTAKVVDDASASLPVGATVTVTASPAKGLGATLETAELLAGAGFDVVPHLAARMIAGPGELAEIAARLREAGISKVFVPSGDATAQAGAYASALQVLEDLAVAGNPFAEVGVTGYPESHPSIEDDLTIQAMWDKRRHATQIVSNLTFDPAVLAAWVRRVRARGVDLPILVGLPGPVERVKLLRMASKIGVGESARFLAKNGGLFARMAAPGGYDPLRFLDRAAATLGRADMNVAGLHLFTFNQVAETERWRIAELARLQDAPPRRRARARVGAPKQSAS